MKKYISFMALVVAFIFSSCSNDEIKVSKAITFKVNPATVVSNLYEYKAGDLTSLTGSYKLQVNLYIYNSDGTLVEKASNNFSAYTHMMTADLYLAPGNYTAVATSHVLGSDIEFWEFSGQDQLSTFKITDAGYIGGKSKILGLTVSHITIGTDSETINIDINNAGAIALVHFTNWNKYTDVESYSLRGKQTCDYVSFNNSGSFDYSTKSESSYMFLKCKFTYDSSKTGTYSYFFTFPIKNASFRFYAKTTNNKDIALSQDFVDDIPLGSSNYFFFDFNDTTYSSIGTGYWWDMTPNSSSAKYMGIIPQERITVNDDVYYDYEGYSISIK